MNAPCKIISGGGVTACNTCKGSDWPGDRLMVCDLTDDAIREQIEGARDWRPKSSFLNGGPGMKPVKGGQRYG
ncbi:hypothetical protein [Martelella sp. HB161492]|uniref:hypothetical protein n=1 Tax=Martelella sp. HB161492 TaxID=2720726 RepID=UPI00158FCC2D|nr:hypothetical protein [Martelella sp. HB161492]